LLIINPF